MLTGSGQPLFSKVQSFNMELLSSSSPHRGFFLFFSFFIAVEPQRERSDGGTATTRSPASHPPLPGAPTEGQCGGGGKSLERGGEVLL